MNGAEICVIGPCSFASTTGCQTAAFCELLSRYFPVSLIPFEPHLRAKDNLTLPSGRAIDICHDTSQIKVSFFVGAIWTGFQDFNFMLVPPHGIRYAYCVWHSDELPARAVEILNGNFDAILVPNQWLESIVTKSGVYKPVQTLPLALDIEGHLSEVPQDPQNDIIYFGTLTSLHPRRGDELLIDAFNEEFNDAPDVRLAVHSYGNFLDAKENIIQKIRHSEKILLRLETPDDHNPRLEIGHTENINFSLSILSEKEKIAFLRKLDVFVSCASGEGVPIAPLEALALGKTVALTRIGGHADIPAAPGIFHIAAPHKIPARYPEINNLPFGHYEQPDIATIRRALREAYNFIRAGHAKSTIYNRRVIAAAYSFTDLAERYAACVFPRLNAGISDKPLPPSTSISKLVEEKTGRYGTKLSFPFKKIILAHDGGFFSIFNSFVSDMVWDLKRNGTLQILPDWRTDRITKFTEGDLMTSFCYGRPEDGNIWVKLFKPLYGLSVEEMTDEKILYRNATVIPHGWSDKRREPFLQMHYAYSLHNASWFQSWRRLYHQYYREHIALLPQYQKEMDEFRLANAGYYLLGVHVRHPSHAYEQANAVMVQNQRFIDSVYHEVKTRGLTNTPWRLFLATDQDRVINRFKEEFGDRVIYFPDLNRTTIEQDEAFDRLPPDKKLRHGFQIQHRTAANPDLWSTRLAWEVIRDSMALASCQAMIYVSSNVSTAISYMNPDLDMVYCRPPD